MLFCKNGTRIGQRQGAATTRSSYFCSACHWGSSAVVPARVIHNWDLSPYPVCQASLQQLRVTSKRPLINLEKLNPRLFSLIHELNLVRRLRRELIGMRKYLLVCREAAEDHLMWKNVDTPHLVDSVRCTACRIL
ncbi:hypothetical protein NQ317_014697 [Molorchus minor]|uniref:Rubicon Homology domain-containing protein n=1 Tax=Molorchus minor TaxID=1323400 RepID=A0ABQ9JHW4_9CUCU|nr:hypothetical protein NQ317_014697 [Molorchus minor]